MNRFPHDLSPSEAVPLQFIHLAEPLNETKLPFRDSSFGNRILAAVFVVMRSNPLSGDVVTLGSLSAQSDIEFGGNHDARAYVLQDDSGCGSILGGSFPSRCKARNDNARKAELVDC